MGSPLEIRIWEVELPKELDEEEVIAWVEEDTLHVAVIGIPNYMTRVFWYANLGEEDRELYNRIVALSSDNASVPYQVPGTAVKRLTTRERMDDTCPKQKPTRRKTPLRVGHDFQESTEPTQIQWPIQHSPL